MNYFTAQMLSRLALLEYKMATLEALIQITPPVEEKPVDPIPEAISATAESKATKAKKEYEIKEEKVIVQTMIPTKNVAP